MSHILKAFIFCLCLVLISCSKTTKNEQNEVTSNKLHHAHKDKKNATNELHKREKRQFGMGGLGGMGGMGMGAMGGLGGMGGMGGMGMGGLGGMGGMGGMGMGGIGGMGGLGGLGGGKGGLSAMGLNTGLGNVGAGLGGLNGLGTINNKQGAAGLSSAGFGGLGHPTFDFADYYANFLADAAYDYYDWVCTGASCQLCDVLTGDCCDPNYDRNCFLPDSCANNPCLSGGSCISTLTVDFRPDFMCVCTAGLTGKYCQLIDEYSAPLPVPVVPVAPAAPSAPVAPAAPVVQQTFQTVAKPATATVQVVQTYPQAKTYQVQQTQYAQPTQQQTQQIIKQAVQSYQPTQTYQAQPAQTYQTVQTQPAQTYQTVQTQPAQTYQTVQTYQAAPQYQSAQTYSTQTLSGNSNAAAPSSNQVFSQDGTYIGTLQSDSIKSLSAKKFAGFSCNCPSNGYCAQILDQDGYEEEEFFCICKDEKRVGSSYGSDCQTTAHKNPCVQSNEVTSADRSIPKNYFIECKGGLPFLRKCHGDSIWNNLNKQCVDFTLHKKRISSGMTMQGTN